MGAAKAAETAEHVQVVKLKNKLGRANAKGKAEGGTIRKDKVKLAKEKALLHASVQKDKRLAAKVAKQKQKATLAKDKAKAEQVALAGAKAKAVAQQAKDAIAEGQTKGQL